MRRPTCEVYAPPLPGDPPAMVRMCGAPAVVAVREEHEVHYRGKVGLRRDAWPVHRCARHDVPEERVTGEEWSDDGWCVSRTVEREVLR